MYKVFITVFCLLLVQRGSATSRYRKDPSESRDVCTIPGFSEPLNNGDRAPGPVGDCNEYVCHADYYEQNECPVYYCETPSTPGDSSKQYPDCCPQKGSDCNAGVA